MAEKNTSDNFLLMFAPERWTFARKFREFMGPPFDVNRELSRGTRAADNHISKFCALAGLANRLRKQLADDEAELQQNGYSPANRSKEYAALIETLFCELYASLDGVRLLLYTAYRNVKGVQNKSTERLFARAKENGYGPEFPADIRDMLATAYDSWFHRLRRIRTEVTHGDIGSCHVDRETQKVIYMHGDLGTNTRAFVLKDVEAELNELFTHVMTMKENVFASLCGKLTPSETTVICGMYKGRAYQRTVTFTPVLSSNDGFCVSSKWFHSEPGLECPLRMNCGAYLAATGNTSEPT